MCVPLIQRAPVCAPLFLRAPGVRSSLALMCAQGVSAQCESRQGVAACGSPAEGSPIAGKSRRGVDAQRSPAGVDAWGSSAAGRHSAEKLSQGVDARGSPAAVVRKAVLGVGGFSPVRGIPGGLISV